MTLSVVYDEHTDQLNITERGHNTTWALVIENINELDTLISQLQDRKIEWKKANE